VWEGWKDPATEEWLRTCTIITGEPNELVAQVHTRMPVILGPQSPYGNLFPLPSNLPDATPWEGSDDETLAHNHYRRSLGRGGQLRSPGAFASVPTASL